MANDIDGSVVLHLRDLVTDLRQRGVEVQADPAFEYLATSGPDNHPQVGHARPARDPARVDVAIGRHPALGIVAAVPADNPQAVEILEGAGFTRRPGSRLHVLEHIVDTVPAAQWTAQVAHTLRQAGHTVSPDATFQELPLHSADLMPHSSARAQAARRTGARASVPGTPAPAPAIDPRSSRHRSH